MQKSFFEKDTTGRIFIESANKGLKIFGSVGLPEPYILAEGERKSVLTFFQEEEEEEVASRHFTGHNCIRLDIRPVVSSVSWTSTRRQITKKISCTYNGGYIC